MAYYQRLKCDVWAFGPPRQVEINGAMMRMIGKECQTMCHFALPKAIQCSLPPEAMAGSTEFDICASTHKFLKWMEYFLRRT